MLLALPLAGQDFGGGTDSTTQQAAALQEANAALTVGDYPAALKLLKPLAEEQPRNARVLYDLGTAQDALDQVSGAETSYRAAIEDDAGFLDPRVALGLLLARGGKLDEARTALLGAVAITNTDQIPEKDKPVRARALRALARIDEKKRPADARNELLAASGNLARDAGGYGAYGRTRGGSGQRPGPGRSSLPARAGGTAE